MKKTLFLSIVVAVFCSCSTHPEATDDYNICAFVWPSCHDDSLGRTNWEEGIGEWEVIKKGNPRFEGHYQPKIP
ncbi:MAG: glycoside hydrolase family 99-like domain-containing protein, partial [Bacteroidales bacterium]|nr:glycoside hydrolase family 99-like domain-containing protein [Bacteroidales bacterium]